MNFKSGLAIAMITGFAVFIEGCKKDDDVKSSNAACLVTGETSNDGTTTETGVITYDASNKPSTVSLTFSGGTGALVETFVYDGTNVTRITTNAGFTVFYSYDGSGRVTQVSNHDDSDVETQKTVYTYNGSGQLIESQDYAQENGEGDVQPFTHDVYSYDNSTTHNAASVQHYVDAIDLNTFSGTDFFEYDSHKAPTSVTATDATSNNVTKITSKNKNAELVNTTTTTYTYNSNDYPVTFSTHSTGNSNGLAATSSTGTYTYKCD